MLERVSVYLYRPPTGGTCGRNEPDLNAPCINFNATVWTEYYLVHTSAIAAAYDDLNADAAAGATACPAAAAAIGGCPIQPVVYASAFALATFSGVNTAAQPDGTILTGAGVYLGNATVANARTRWPGYSQDPALANMDVYSLHSYGKLGNQLLATGSALTTSIAEAWAAVTPAGGAPPPPLVVTEHAAHTGAAWNGIPSTADDDFEAARLASQLVFMASAGYETYVFKFSNTNSMSGGTVKSGIFWGEVRADKNTRGGMGLPPLARSLACSPPPHGGRSAAIPGGGLRPPPDPHPHCAARGSTGLRLGEPCRAALWASRPQGSLGVWGLAPTRFAPAR